MGIVLLVICGGNLHNTMASSVYIMFSIFQLKPIGTPIGDGPSPLTSGCCLIGKQMIALMVDGQLTTHLNEKNRSIAGDIHSV